MRRRFKSYVLKGSSNIKTVEKINCKFLDDKKIMVNSFNPFNPQIIRL